MKKSQFTSLPVIPPIVGDVSEQLDFRDCDLEQIQLSGHIQPYGILIGIDELATKIVQVSENIVDFCGVPAIAVIDQTLDCIFPQFQIDIFASFSTQKDLEILNPIQVTIQIEDREYLFHAVMHRADGLLILELEALSQNSNNDLRIYHEAQSTAASIRKSADFNEMIDLLVRKIREITQYDRVLIYQFDRDNSGDVIAECKEESLESLLGLHYPATDISTIARNLYCLNWVRLIVDINYRPVPILPPQNPITGEPLDLSFSILRSVSKFHVRYLGGMGVCASLCISLITDDDKLWGMIVCHHYSPKYLDYKTRKTCEFLGQLLSVSIINKHEKLIDDCRLKIKQIQSKLKQSILDGSQLMDNRFTENVDDLLNLVSAQGAVICLNNRTSILGQCPSQEFISRLLLWIKSQSQDILYTNSLSELYPEAIEVKDLASGLLAISISLNHTSYHIIWFRPEVIQTVNWAGNPNQLTKLINMSDDENFPSPGRSFELWKETVKAKSLAWNNAEVDAAMELRGTLMLTALEFSQQEIKEEAERARVASQAKSSFLARMSHELRTPLNAILGCTQLMESEALTKVLQEYVSIIGHSSEHLLDLIDDVLEVSKIEAGKITLEETNFDLHQLLNGVKEMIQIRAKDKDLQMIFAIHPHLPQFVKSDERKIRQILLNLLGNAIKFTNKGYVILKVSLVENETETEVGTDPVTSKATIHFEIEDTGAGIAPEEIDSLFEAFVQTTSGRESQTGTGLGLVISQQFAHFLGGHISASSSLNKGTVFQFDITVEKLVDVEIKTSQIAISEQPAIEIAEETSKQDVSDSLRILLVEDTTYNQLIGLKFLEKLGYQADLAVNGLEALKALEHKFYDLILMDIQMPEMDGLETTRRIRRKEKDTMAINKVKIVAMTANTMAEDRENCILTGMDDFIGKPIRIDELDRVLQKFSIKQTAINR